MARTFLDTVTTPAAARTPISTSRPIVTLLSDFGARDPSAGIMRAVVLGICRDAVIVDLSHEVDKFAVRDGALLLWCAAPYLPIGAHVAVVDPGVGTARMGIAIQTARGDYLVGPDNGILMPAAARLGGIVRAHLLEDPSYSLSPVSTSFHGRDVFAPAAAHLAARLPIERLGRAVDPRRLMELDWPRPEIGPGLLRSHAIYVDTFGNVKLSALTADLEAALPGLRPGDQLIVRITDQGGTREVRAQWAVTFGSVPVGAPLVYGDSYGRSCLALNQGSAALRYGIEPDAEVTMSRPPGHVADGRPPGARPGAPRQAASRPI